MKIYSYVVRRDFGFAPNPFHGFCTLATCKKDIRLRAAVGDWLLGTGGADYGLTGRLVYAMEITEDASFEEYWNDSRFRSKRPSHRGSLKDKYGDNIYRRLATGEWLQADSHHSNPDGSANMRNQADDTSANRVLISSNFCYWGEDAIVIPDDLFGATKVSLVKQGPGYKTNFAPAVVGSTVSWLRSILTRGVLGSPSEFARDPVG